MPFFLNPCLKFRRKRKKNKEPKVLVTNYVDVTTNVSNAEILRAREQNTRTANHSSHEERVNANSFTDAQLQLNIQENNHSSEHPNIAAENNEICEQGSPANLAKDVDEATDSQSNLIYRSNSDENIIESEENTEIFRPTSDLNAVHSSAMRFSGENARHGFELVSSKCGILETADQSSGSSSPEIPEVTELINKIKVNTDVFEKIEEINMKLSIAKKTLTFDNEVPKVKHFGTSCETGSLLPEIVDGRESAESLVCELHKNACEINVSLNDKENITDSVRSDQNIRFGDMSLNEAEYPCSKSEGSNDTSKIFEEEPQKVNGNVPISSEIKKTLPEHSKATETSEATTKIFSSKLNISCSLENKIMAGDASLRREREEVTDSSYEGNLNDSGDKIKIYEDTQSSHINSSIAQHNENNVDTDLHLGKVLKMAFIGEEGTDENLWENTTSISDSSDENICPKFDKRKERKFSRDLENEECNTRYSHKNNHEDMRISAENEHEQIIYDECLENREISILCDSENTAVTHNLIKNAFLRDNNETALEDSKPLGNFVKNNLVNSVADCSVENISMLVKKPVPSKNSSIASDNESETKEDSLQIVDPCDVSENVLSSIGTNRCDSYKNSKRNSNFKDMPSDCTETFNLKGSDSMCLNSSRLNSTHDNINSEAVARAIVQEVQITNAQLRENKRSCKGKNIHMSSNVERNEAKLKNSREAYCGEIKAEHYIQDLRENTEKESVSSTDTNSESNEELKRYNCMRRSSENKSNNNTRKRVLLKSDSDHDYKAEYYKDDVRNPFSCHEDDSNEKRSYRKSSESVTSQSDLKHFDEDFSFTIDDIECKHNKNKLFDRTFHKESKHDNESKVINSDGNMISFCNYEQYSEYDSDIKENLSNTNGCIVHEILKSEIENDMSHVTRRNQAKKSFSVENTCEKIRLKKCICSPSESSLSSKYSDNDIDKDQEAMLDNNSFMISASEDSVKKNVSNKSSKMEKFYKCNHRQSFDTRCKHNPSPLEMKQKVLKKIRRERKFTINMTHKRKSVPPKYKGDGTIIGDCIDEKQFIEPKPKDCFTVEETKACNNMVEPPTEYEGSYNTNDEYVNSELTCSLPQLNGSDGFAVELPKHLKFVDSKKIEVERKASIEAFKKQKIKAAAVMLPNSRIIPIQKTESFAFNLDTEKECMFSGKDISFDTLLKEGIGEKGDGSSNACTQFSFQERAKKERMSRMKQKTSLYPEFSDQKSMNTGKLEDMDPEIFSSDSETETSSETSINMTPTRKRILDASRSIRSPKYPFKIYRNTSQVGSLYRRKSYVFTAPKRNYVAYLARDEKNNIYCVKRGRKVYDDSCKKYKFIAPESMNCRSPVLRHRIVHSAINRATSPENLKARFDDKFKRYASRGRNNGELISYKRSTEWLRDAGVVGEVLTAAEANDTFKCTAGVKVALNKGDYRHFLKKLTRMKRLNYNEIYERLCSVKFIE